MKNKMIVMIWFFVFVINFIFLIWWFMVWYLRKRFYYFFNVFDIKIKRNLGFFVIIL